MGWVGGIGRWEVCEVGQPEGIKVVEGLGAGLTWGPAVIPIPLTSPLPTVSPPPGPLHKACSLLLFSEGPRPGTPFSVGVPVHGHHLEHGRVCAMTQVFHLRSSRA
jgi:hypothetical protein